MIWIQDREYQKGDLYRRSTQTEKEGWVFNKKTKIEQEVFMLNQNNLLKKNFSSNSSRVQTVLEKIMNEVQLLNWRDSGNKLVKTMNQTMKDHTIRI